MFSWSADGVYPRLHAIGGNTPFEEMFPVAVFLGHGGLGKKGKFKEVLEWNG